MAAGAKKIITKNETGILLDMQNFWFFPKLRLHFFAR